MNPTYDEDKYSKSIRIDNKVVYIYGATHDGIVISLNCRVDDDKQVYHIMQLKISGVWKTCRECDGIFGEDAL